MYFFALSLPLKQRFGATQKWPVSLSSDDNNKWCDYDEEVEKQEDEVTIRFFELIMIL